VLQQPDNTQGLVVRLKPFPRALGRDRFDEGHFDAISDDLPPSRPSIRRANISSIQLIHHRVFRHHEESLRKADTIDNSAGRCVSKARGKFEVKDHGESQGDSLLKPARFHEKKRREICRLGRIHPSQCAQSVRPAIEPALGLQNPGSKNMPDEIR
jgi:hypothetical protein